jgi:hypothetical protein
VSRFSKKIERARSFWRLHTPPLFLEHLSHITDLALHLSACFFHRAAINRLWRL